MNNEFEYVPQERLLEYKKSAVVTGVKILSAGGLSCESCNKLDQKIMTIDQAIAEHLLPCKDCTFKLRKKDTHFTCRCCYVPLVD